MKKIAIIKLEPTKLELILADVLENESFIVFDQMQERINLLDDIKEFELIKSVKISQTIEALKVFKALIIANEIFEVHAITTEAISKARNQKSFLDDIYDNCGFNFTVLSKEEQLRYDYIATINSLDIPKGIIIDVQDDSIRLVQYNRRNILNQAVLDFGALTLLNSVENKDDSFGVKCEKIMQVCNETIGYMDWLKEITPEFQLVGLGDIFKSLGRISRKARKYPLDLDHNYVLNLLNFEKVFELIKNLEIDKAKKIKGIGSGRVDVLASGLAIIKCFLDAITPETITISKNGLTEGVLYSKACPITNEKPITDILGHSINAISKYNEKTPNNSEHVYNLSMILFKQLRVLHKLSRSYIKVLRIASLMHDSGKVISNINYQKQGFDVIINSDITGVTHRELFLAAMTVYIQDLDNFSIPTWVKYKDLVEEEDLVGVQKMALIVRLASSLDRFMKKRVTDINCDILGDAVIMKTTSENGAELEIREAIKASGDFKKAYSKMLEVL